MLTLADVVQARDRIQQYLHPTPLEPGLRGNVWLKLENANLTHSFKIRGALNALLSLSEAARKRGVIASSSGNHAQGLAYAAQLAGVRAKILMPLHTPRRKVDGVRRYGAEAVLFGDNYDQTEAEALRIGREAGMTFISPYNDAAVVAGAGTISLEILDQLPQVERVVVCVSGGGLISGVAMVVKSRKPAAEVIGVNALSAPAMYNYFYGKQYPQRWDTLAEALSGDIEPDAITLAMTKQYVDQIVLVTEDDIAAAMRWLVDTQGWIVEGGGAVGVAALLGGVIPADDKPTAVVVSGGNVDGSTLRRVLLGLV